MPEPIVIIPLGMMLVGNLITTGCCVAVAAVGAAVAMYRWMRR